MKIIAFTGMPFTGKSEAVRIAQTLQIPVVRMGDTIWAEVKKRKLPLTDENVGAVATEMRQTHGKDIWAKKTFEILRSFTDKACVVIDGIRNLEETLFFKNNLKANFILIAIEASLETRKQRFLIRKRVDDGDTLQSFEERNTRERSWGLGEVIASADIVIPNNHHLEEFQDKVKQVFQQLIQL